LVFNKAKKWISCRITLGFSLLFELKKNGNLDIFMRIYLGIFLQVLFDFPADSINCTWGLPADFIWFSYGFYLRFFLRNLPAVLPKDLITYEGISWELESAGNVFPADFWSKSAGNKQISSSAKNGKFEIWTLISSIMSLDATYWAS
jgi:hypothetical protein